ncbi:MAG: hypothetical protein ACI9BF_000790 [Candidatus Paceibacteria bacterium]
MGRIESLLKEYEELKTIEAKFVKAIDRQEPNFHMYDAAGREFLHKAKSTREIHANYKGDFTKAFPIMARYEEVLEEQYEKGGFYYTKS